MFLCTECVSIDKNKHKKTNNNDNNICSIVTMDTVKYKEKGK